jgi:hypothetical protein
LLSLTTFSTSYASNCLSLTLSGRQQQQQPFGHINDDNYTALILEESEKIYNKLTIELTNGVISATAMRKPSSLPSPSLSVSANNNRHR